MRFNFEHIQELIKKNRHGILMKLMRENIHEWSKNNYHDIYRDFVINYQRCYNYILIHYMETILNIKFPKDTSYEDEFECLYPETFKTIIMMYVKNNDFEHLYEFIINMISYDTSMTKYIIKFLCSKEMYFQCSIYKFGIHRIMLEYINMSRNAYSMFKLMYKNLNKINYSYYGSSKTSIIDINMMYNNTKDILYKIMMYDKENSEYYIPTLEDLESITSYEFIDIFGTYDYCVKAKQIREKIVKKLKLIM